LSPEAVAGPGRGPFEGLIEPPSCGSIQAIFGPVAPQSARIRRDRSWC